MASDTIASQKVMIYLGIPICFAGIIGGLLNITVFLSLQTFRENSCAFYLTVISFVNLGQLLTGFLPRLMLSGFNIDWTQSSLVYCKFRWFYVQLCLLTTFTCLCLATIDQYCATCSRPHWRRCSNIKSARRLCIIFILIWLLHGIPYALYYNHIILPDTSVVTCAITNIIFQQYFIYWYVLILAGILPVIITVVFGVLAYRNIQQITFQTTPIIRRELDKQLTTMVLVQVIFNFFAIIPYIIMMIFSIEPHNLTKPVLISQQSLGLIITICLYYLYFSVCIIDLKHYLFISSIFSAHSIFIFVYPNDFVNN
jgi:hypothetical protein